jgi:hypothetical protein
MWMRKTIERIYWQGGNDEEAKKNISRETM